jgi:hypothetical protein
MLPRRPRPILFHILSAFLASAVGFFAASSPAAQETGSIPRLTYTKVLKQSVPEYLSISVDANGSGTYEGRKLGEPSEPRPLKLSSATTRRLFTLAARLNHFQSSDLESHKKVANLGLKTLTYEEGGQKTEVEFNYTVVREADALVGLFEKIASVEQHVTVLEYAIKYDHLSLPRELLQIQIDLDSKVLADADLMVPQLEEIARNPHFLHLAQVRAQKVLQRLQNTD